MSTEGATAFYERMSSDEEFRSQVDAAETPEGKHRIVSAAGYDVSPDDLQVIRNLAGVSELSDEDLEKVAGGTGTNTGVGATLGIVGGAAAAAAAAV
jgi:predicted ribosomally synthesized peptide with nif11-like leader